MKSPQNYARVCLDYYLDSKMSHLSDNTSYNHLYLAEGFSSTSWKTTIAKLMFYKI